MIKFEYMKMKTVKRASSKSEINYSLSIQFLGIAVLL